MIFYFLNPSRNIPRIDIATFGIFETFEDNVNKIIKIISRISEFFRNNRKNS